MACAAPFTPTVYFPLTVDEALSQKAQLLLKTECADLIGDMNCEALPARHQTRIWIYVKAATYGLLLHALILGLPSAEFGALKPAATLRPVEG
ncbi:hypothetical protein [Asticcacaulis machinosus]|uniref:Uncharacterized protein n=1 Tax=Asticcacaulis machinosus TaxID=2984211 RepID=A0ABT5HNA1_9CAUL|nr:hypothetical protein [Asticcacaulis machinosus]MDC7677700.1 hypothetical protein [Asticcacaulis machinosus]